MNCFLYKARIITLSRAQTKLMCARARRCRHFCQTLMNQSSRSDEMAVAACSRKLIISSVSIRELVHMYFEGPFPQLQVPAGCDACDSQDQINVRNTSTTLVAT